MNRIAPLWTTLAIVGCALLVSCSNGSPAGSSSAGSSSAGSSSAGSSSAGSSSAGTQQPKPITLVAYDSFPTKDTSLNTALDDFTTRTGIPVKLLIAGDTGTMLSKASLTAGNPEGDVMWGVDNTFLSRAVDDNVFDPYKSPGLDRIPAALTALVPNGEATPVDYGDVCVNYDVGWFNDRQLAVPKGLDDLTDPAYANLLVVQNPATSSPGLAFLLATIDQYGTTGWQAYWKALRANGVKVVDSWTDAYYDQFSATGKGQRPLVVSYGSSPPAGVIFGDPPTGAIESTCFRQVEFAGVLRGTKAPQEARRLVDFLIDKQFQSELALNLFVYPANADVALPKEFIGSAVIPSQPRSIDPAEIEANRADWIDTWTELVTG